MNVETYLYFDGRCEEALEFYQQAVGAEVLAVIRFGESPTPTEIPPGSENKVMHSLFRIGETKIMASDGYCGNTPSFKGFALALNAAETSTAERLFAALSDGGRVEMPLTATFFSPSFGMVEDRFGVMWMVLVPAPFPGS
ncbi:VOC family protein [Planctomicrobium sp. SH664]|uniref:VOC family protein n=1 Tax=Planctomicrobium sp. SH664 TaxID=3448125 RepID=UPI003F5C5743